MPTCSFEKTTRCLLELSLQLQVPHGIKDTYRTLFNHGSVQWGHHPTSGQSILAHVLMGEELMTGPSPLAKLTLRSPHFRNSPLAKHSLL